MKLNKRAVEILRGTKQLSISALARMARVSEKTISKGFIHDINPVSVARIAKTLGVEISDIMQKEKE